MRAIVPFVFQVIALQLTKCQGSSGGPSTFGYDASSACSKPYSRTGRTHVENLPCDFRRQNWCTTAGSTYPWHAVRRFVQENQGLMRRMYGDESYINILRSEFEKNDIEFKYDEYHQPLVDDLRQFQYDDNYELVDDDQSKLGADEDGSRRFTSRSFNEPIGKRLKFPKLSEYTRPHFKPTERTTSSTIPSSTKTPSSILSTMSTSTTTSEMHTSSLTTPVSNITVMSTDEKQEKEIKPESLATSVSPKFSNTTFEIGDNGDVAVNNTTTTALPSTVTQIVREQNFSINEIPGQNDRIDEDLEELGEVEAHSEETMIREETTLDSTGTTTTMSVVLSTESLIDRDEEAEVLSSVTKTTVHEELLTVASYEQQQQFRPRPEYRPPSESSASVSGQLYQDVAAKDHHEQPVLKLRGVNACPVKEEVVAPFWANNTRGEVLALLNLYPFEQYVHWEKCTHENKQMYCRDGCRCEQQYRLHRLLAYDPNNECRGIFSDWFKFPSCCVCRCYDLPLEFRVTSRSPRTLRKRRRIKIQPPARDRYP